MTWLGFSGDVMLGRLVDETQRERDPAEVWGDLRPHLDALDGLFVNLECCISSRGTPWARTHKQLHFRATPERARPALEAGGVTCASLANDHVLDYGEVALGDTLDALEEWGVARAGAGRTAEEAWQPASVSVDGLDVAVVSVTDADAEYAAGEDDPGVAVGKLRDDRPDRDRVAEALARAREQDPDLLVASLHWGRHMAVEPPAAHERFARWLAGQGVDLVHGHGSSLVQGVEVVDGTPVVYDAGSFVDDFDGGTGLRNDLSVLPVAGVDEAGLHKLELHPVASGDCAARAATGEAAATVRDVLRERSRDYGTAFERDGDALVVTP